MNKNHPKWLEKKEKYKMCSLGIIQQRAEQYKYSLLLLCVIGK